MVTEPERTREGGGDPAQMRRMHTHSYSHRQLQGWRDSLPLILALQKFLDLGQNCSAQVQLPQGARETAGYDASSPPNLPTFLLLLEATYAFWLTMFRRSTTTDRSLMATAESTDVCRQAPLRGQHGMGVGGVGGMKQTVPTGGQGSA